MRPRATVVSPREGPLRLTSIKLLKQPVAQAIVLVTVVLTVSLAYGQPQLTITASSNQQSFPPSSAVVIQGKVSDSSGVGVSGASVSVQVNNPNGESVHVGLVFTGSDGIYQDTFSLRLDTLLGTYKTFVATSKPGFQDASTDFTFTVASAGPSDFAIAVSPTSQTVKLGSSVGFAVTITKVGLFNSQVALQTLNLPSGFTANFNPQTLQASGSSMLTITISDNAQTGVFVFTIQASGGGLIHSQDITISVSGCFIATAAYGSESAGDVLWLRQYRDTVLMQSMAGTQFMEAFNAIYYKLSPSLARMVSEHNSLKALVRIGLAPLLNVLKLSIEATLVSGIGGEAAALLQGVLSAVALGVIYIAPAVWIGRIVRDETVGALRKRLLPIVVESSVLIFLGELMVQPQILRAGIVTFVPALMLFGAMLPFFCEKSNLLE